MTAKRMCCIGIVILGSNILSFPARAEVPVNDASRLGKETNTRVCMERSRTYKKRAEKPTEGVRDSFASPGSAPAPSLAGTDPVNGGTFNGMNVGGVDLSAIMFTAGAIAAIKARNSGEALGAIAATTAAIAANQAALAAQGQSIGSADTVQGAMDQNSAARLSSTNVWNQAIEAGNTTLKLRNQALLDEAAAASKAARIWEASGGVTLDLPENTTSQPTAKVRQEDLLNELERLQAEAEAKELSSTHPEQEP
uniref:Uncharacterized protein n=1 Tax=Ochrobactrum sp. LM19 TaxID=1449781 RepID=A0A0D5A1E3_9HYPH|nr:hypothetical protein [Ochrobactrum sp. LM19]AJW30001.1 hypothetical protein pLM19O2_p56 [Ochrobactrum sp. LM19]